MKDTLLAIHSYAGANGMVKLLWPYYKMSGCDILGIGRTNAKCEWPELVPSVDVGEDPFKPWCEHRSDNLPRRLIETLEVCLNDYPQYHDYCIVEWDSIFVKPLESHTGGLVSVPCVVGKPWKDIGFTSNVSFLGPWWFDKTTALQAIATGRMLLDQGKIEFGSPDFFLGLIADISGFKYSALPVYFQMALDHPRFVGEARQHYQDRDVFYIHGIKTPQMLESVVSK